MTNQPAIETTRIQVTFEHSIDQMLIAMINTGGFGSNKSDVITKILTDYRLHNFVEDVAKSEMITDAAKSRI